MRASTGVRVQPAVAAVDHDVGRDELSQVFEAVLVAARASPL
jgi:hypothetical protein